jgi:hypothetical protein
VCVVCVGRYLQIIMRLDRFIIVARSLHRSAVSTAPRYNSLALTPLGWGGIYKTNNNAT